MTKSALSNCYTPIKVAAATDDDAQPTSTLQDRTNGNGEPRTNETLRRLCLETSVLASSKPGSSLVELGHTKILCHVSLGVDGNHAQVDTGVLLVRVSQAANFGMPPPSAVSTLDKGVSRNNSNKAALSQSVDMEARLHAALLPALNLADYRKTVIQLEIVVLQNDGSLLSACLLAATLALCDARVDLYDVVTCCEVVVVGATDSDSSELIFLADPTLAEEEAASAKLTLAIMPNWKEVTLWQQSGAVPDLDSAMNLCRDGCRTLQRFLRQHLMDKEQQ
jgi:exosome complex component MTR3